MADWESEQAGRDDPSHTEDIMRRHIDMYRSALFPRNPARQGLRAFVLTMTLAVMAACSDATTGDKGEEPVTPVARVDVSPANRTIMKGETTPLQATPKDRIGNPLSGRALTWSTSNAAVATVAANGLVSAVGIGEVTISATAEGKTGGAFIVVNEPPAEHIPVRQVTIEPAAISLAWNEVRQIAATPRNEAGQPLDGRSVTWVVNDPSVAEVDQTGRVTARKTGSTMLSATSEGVTASAELVVRQAPVNRVILSVSELALETGESTVITATLEDPLGREITDRAVAWTSSNQSDVFVNGDGRVHALATGSATITATSEGKSAEVQVLAMSKPQFDLIYDRPIGMEGAEIFILGLGTPSMPLKLNAGNVSRDPSPSPDGTRYVFAVTQRDLTTGLLQNDLYVVNRNGMNMRWLTRTGGIEEQPAWSPDGTRIAFSAMNPTNGEVDIWVMNVDEPGLYNLTASLGRQSNEHAPAWSPDGSKIAFATTGILPHGRIWIMNAIGTNHTPLNEDAGVDNHPTWSPDGEYIAFQRSGVGVTGTDIMTVRITGGVATRIALPGEQYTPSWSPDGAYIAFSNQIGGIASQIYTMRPDGKGVRLRTTELSWGGGRNPSWITRQQ